MKKALTVVCDPYPRNRGRAGRLGPVADHRPRKAGGEMTVLLAESAVKNYAVRDQDPTGVALGSVGIERPPRPDCDLLSMKQAGIQVYFVREDAEERGIPAEKLELFRAALPLGDSRPFRPARSDLAVVIA